MMLTPNGGTPAFDGFPWAADTGRFSSPARYSDERYLMWLSRRPYAERCLFATAPDVVGDAEATLLLSLPMLARIRELVPVALVAQDGLTLEMVPWDDIDALFIGGTTAWKLGPDAEILCRAAKACGRWVHMGRVNSWRRMEYARAIGCDSVDGTYLRFDPLLRRSPGPDGWMERAASNRHIWGPRP